MKEAKREGHFLIDSMRPHDMFTAMTEKSTKTPKEHVLSKLAALSDDEMKDLKSRLSAASQAPDGHNILRELASSPALGSMFDNHDRVHDTHDRVND